MKIKPGELWARANRPAVIILKPQGGDRYVLATLTTGQKSMTGRELSLYLNGYQRAGILKP